MKKHLLFMLMALLPAFGWAVEDISNKVLIGIGNVEYGQTTDPDLRVTMDGTDVPAAYWEKAGYYLKNDGTGSAVALNKINVGVTAYVKINFKGVYSGTAYGKFTVSKATVEVDVENAAFFTKVYLAADPTIAKANITAVKVSGVDKTSEIDDYLTVGTLKYTYDGEDADDEGYAITFSGIALKDSKNYQLKINERKMVINPKPITASAPFTFKSNYTAGEFTYNADKQRPTYKVEWDHDGDAKTKAIVLKEGRDFKLKFNGAVSTVNAGTYNVTISGINNYEGADVPISEFNFEIKKAPLTIMALPQTKVYDGEAFDLATAKFNISGRVGADATTTVTDLSATGSPAANVDTYSVGVDVASAKVGDVLLSTNYDITTVPMDWTVTARKVTLTVGDATMTKGGAWPAMPGITVELKEGDSETGALNAVDQDDIAGCYTVARADAAGEPLEGLTTSTVEIKDYADAFKAVETSTPSANYAIDFKLGTLKVSGAGFTVMPVVESDIEYGNSYTIGYYTAGTIDESKLVFVIGDKEYPYNKTQIEGLPTEIANYNVAIKEGTAVGTGNNANGEATLLKTAYSIIKRKITINVKNQTVHSEDPEAILAELTEGDKGYDLASGSLVDGDELELTYSFDPAVVNIQGGKIKGYKTGKSATDDAIKVTATPSKNPHYDITVGTLGKLTIDPTHVIDLAAATAEADIKDAAANGSDYYVYISGRKLNGNKWNVLVLPFEVKTFDFCKVIGGYAVFNVLKSAEGDNVKFGLELDKIPANQPFLVKPLADVDFDHKSGTPAVKDIKFEGVKIVKGEPKQTVGDASLIGTYKDMTIEDDSFYAVQGGAWKHYSSPVNLGFTRAYLDMANESAEVRFFVEEPNGETTAIKELNAETMQSVDAEGWYTIDGKKLSAAPTQKGLYINNGKKVIINK